MLIRAIRDGDLKAAEFLFNRGEGMALQRQEITGKDGSPLISEQVINAKIPENADEREAANLYADFIKQTKLAS